MPLWLDYISHVSIGNDYIVYFRSALRMAIEDCTLFQKTSDRVDGVCLRVWFGYERVEQQIWTFWQLGLARPTSPPGLAGYQA